MAMFTRVSAVVAAISGLGSVFVEKPRSAKWLKWLIIVLYRFAFQHPNLTAIFQNPDDKELLISLGIVREDQSSLIRGSGIVLKDYPLKPEPDGVPTVTLASRLLR